MIPCLEKALWVGMGGTGWGLEEEVKPLRKKMFLKAFMWLVVLLKREGPQTPRGLWQTICYLFFSPSLLPSLCKSEYPICIKLVLERHWWRLQPASLTVTSDSQGRMRDLIGGSHVNLGPVARGRCQKFQGHCGVGGGLTFVSGGVRLTLVLITFFHIYSKWRTPPSLIHYFLFLLCNSNR